MKKIILFLTILLVAAVLPSCGPSLTSPQEVIKLEVLSVKTDKPQAHPGDVVQADILIGMPEDYTGEYHTVGLLCDPKSSGSSSLAFATCMNPEESNFVGTPALDSESFSVTVPEDTLSAYGLENKYLYLMFIVCEADGDTCFNSMNSGEGNPFENDIFKLTLKRINVIPSTEEITNGNPVIEKIFVDDEEINPEEPLSLEQAEKGKKFGFKVQISSDSFDKKTDPDGELIDETVSTAWKSNSGLFDYYYTNQEKDETLDDFDENPFEIPSEAESFKIYVIATDSKGGIDWKVLSVNSIPASE